jgi:P-loop Domain of unknown function (DUF2791)
VIRLQNLSPEDLFVLLHNIRSVFALGDPSRYLVDEEAMKAFMNHCARTLGSDFFLTPRDAVKAFVGLLSVLEQNPGADVHAMLAATKVEHDVDPESLPVPLDAADMPLGPAPPADDELTSFRL